jgi:type I restriction enzyme S subunit
MADVKESGGVSSSAVERYGDVKNGFTRFAENDVLFAKITPCMENGKGALAVNLEGGIGCGSTEFHVLRAIGENSPEFIYHLLQSSALRLKAETFMSGSAGQQRVLSEFFYKHNVSIPNPASQRRIGGILSTVDEAIEQTEALIAKTEQVKAGLMHDLFTRGVTSEGRLRPPREEAPHLYKETPLGWVPKEWEVIPLRDKLSFISYGFTNPMPETADGPYMVTAADVHWAGVQYESCRRTSWDAYNRKLTSKSRPIVGDILLTKDGTLGRVALVDRNNVCINQSVAVLRLQDVEDAEFLLTLLGSPQVQQNMLHDAGGSTIKHIYISIVAEMPIVWPRPGEREMLHSITMKHANKIQALHSEANKLAFLKAGLTSVLLSTDRLITPTQSER